jgi:hypothetical protein
VPRERAASAVETPTAAELQVAHGVDSFTAQEGRMFPLFLSRLRGACLGNGTPHKNIDLQALREALWRTRTADPLLTMEDSRLREGDRGTALVYRFSLLLAYLRGQPHPSLEEP